jgi:hypothetical protein
MDSSPGEQVPPHPAAAQPLQPSAWGRGSGPGGLRRALPALRHTHRLRHSGTCTGLAPVPELSCLQACAARSRTLRRCKSGQEFEAAEDPLALLDRLRADAGPWHELAKTLPALARAGIDATAVEAETGLERARQNTWAVAEQARAHRAPQRMACRLACMLRAGMLQSVVRTFEACGVGASVCALKRLFSKRRKGAWRENILMLLS